MGENKEDLSARLKALEYEVHGLKQLVRRLNRKLAVETQPAGLASGMGFEPAMEREPVEELRLELEEEQELDCEDEFEVELEEEFETEAVEELVPGGNADDE